MKKNSRKRQAYQALRRKNRKKFIAKMGKVYASLLSIEKEGPPKQWKFANPKSQAIFEQLYNGKFYEETAEVPRHVWEKHNANY